MKNHIKRRIEYSKDVVPEEGTKEFELVTHMYEEKLRQNPNLQKELDKKFKQAVKTLELQNLNGVGLNMDSEIRHFLNEFNHRSWAYGHLKMPVMFNIMEAFVTLDKTLNSWKLLDEEDYLISFFDFIDFYTSNKFENNLEEIKDNLEEDLIYNYNVGSDLKEITFKTNDGNEFVIGGISLVRRGNEVTMLFLTGQIIDTNAKTKELVPLEEMKRVVGKEKIKISDRKREAVKLNDDSQLWKVLVACRFDLDTNTIDARYIAQDEGNSFAILTDDVTGFMTDEDWRSDGLKEVFKNMAKQVESYNSIFELAKVCLFLPQYFNVFEDNIVEENHETELKSLLNNPIRKRKFNDVEHKYKIRNRSLWLLNQNHKFSSDRVKLRDDKFKIETSGFWRKLNFNEIGTDKKGQQVTAKTWVKRTDSYYEANTDELIIENKSNDVIFDDENSGLIYIMRNANFEKNIFKIGLTTKETENRAKQLSKTSVPDKFYVMREWIVRDCIKAEKEIHKILNIYRVDERREFFKLDMKIANRAIDEVVNKINMK